MTSPKQGGVSQRFTSRKRRSNRHGLSGFVQFRVKVHPRDMARIEKRAAKWGIGRSHFVSRALGHYLELEELIEKGWHITARDLDGNEQVLDLSEDGVLHRFRWMDAQKEGGWGD